MRVARSLAVSAAGASVAAPGRLALLREPDFLALWSIGAITSTIRWLEVLAVGVYVFDVTGSPLLVAAMTILRMLPLALLGAFAGAIAERFPRLHILLVGLIAMVVVDGVLGLLALAGALELWHIAVGTLLAGVFWVTDFPVRRAMMGDIAGAGQVGPAMSLDTITNNGTRMLGPGLGGLFLELIGIDGTFLVGAVLYAVSFLMILRVGYSDAGRALVDGNVVRSVLAGFRYLRTNRLLIAVLLVTVIFNVWGFPFISMIPVIGKDELGLRPFLVGLLASAEGAGALVGALWLALFGPMRHYRRFYVYGLALYLAMAFGFALSSDARLSGSLLILGGLGAAGYAAMQSTLTILSAPPEVRGRMMGVLSVCIGTGPIGFLHLGLMADWLGAPLATAIVALEGLAALALLVWWRPELLAPQPQG